jgi:hypothetical protein
MSHEKRLGWAALVMGLLGAAASILWPEQKWIGWIFFAGAICSGIGWGYLEIRPFFVGTEVTSGPKLNLRHVDPTGDRFVDTSGLFVQVEGPKKAFGVKIASADTVGRDHTRLEMLWSDINEPVGNDPVPVTVLCSLHKGTTSQSFVGSQLEQYRRLKAVEPKDLIATVRFKDVDGNECPPRKFKIYRERDLNGHLKTFCELVRD